MYHLIYLLMSLLWDARHEWVKEYYDSESFARRNPNLSVVKNSGPRIKESIRRWNDRILVRELMKVHV